MTEHDGSFRRLMEMVREQQATPDGRPGRPPKNRVSTTGHFSFRIHDRMKSLAKEHSEAVDYTVSASDLYNSAALQLITDLHDLLGPELRLPAGAVTMAGILGLRELMDRPVLDAFAGVSVAERRTAAHDIVSGSADLGCID